MTVLDAAYRERAHLVAHLATCYKATIGYTDPDEPDWAVILIDLPAGQVAWHISPEDMELFGHVRRDDDGVWDGHTTEEKYRRLDAATGLMARMTEGMRGR